MASGTERGLVRADRGSATVLGMAAIGVVLLVLMALAMLSAALITRQQAQTAADLGAVAGAQVLKAGGAQEDACDQVGRFVADNGAELDECTLRAFEGRSGPQVHVVVSRAVPVGPGWVARVTARAGLIRDG